MCYYKVKPQYDQKRVNGKGYIFLIANELYTPYERKKLKDISDECFEVVEIPKCKTYWFFGARFAK